MDAVQAEKAIFYQGSQEMRQLALAADEATRNEHQMTPWQAMVRYRKGVLWAFIISLTVVLGGFDLVVCGTLIAVPEFQKRYGYEYDPVNAPGEFIISTPWQQALNVGVISAQVVGAVFGGPLADRFGRKAPIHFCLLGNTAFIFLEMFATNLGMLFAGEFLNGICYGFYFVLAPTYAAEVVPHHLRNISIAMSNMALITGTLIGQGALTGTQGLTSVWAYRGPFALQWIWCLIVGSCLWLCPESPWYLVHRGRMDEARHSLDRLAMARNPQELTNTIAMMEKTVRLEKEYQKSSTYRECFRGTNLRRTEIASFPFTIQIMTSVLFATTTYLLSLSGLSSRNAFLMGLGTYALGFVTNLIYYPLMTIVGRRPAFLWGSVAIGVIFLLVGFLDLSPNYTSNRAFAWAQAVLLIVAYGVNMLTTGPTSWVIMSETASTRLRSKTVSIAVAIQDIFYLPVALGVAYEVNPDQANWRGKMGFLYGGFALIGALWAYFRLPELSGRTYEEMDLLFEQRLPAKAFKNYQLDILASVPRNEAPTDTLEQGGAVTSTNEKVATVN